MRFTTDTKWIVLGVLILVAHVIVADEHHHSYQRNDRIYVWVNKVGPLSNPHETYPFYQLYDGCPPKDAMERASSLGEIIEGNSVVRSHIVFPFRTNVNSQVVCEAQLTSESAARYIAAVQDRYWFEMYIGMHFPRAFAVV